MLDRQETVYLQENVVSLLRKKYGSARVVYYNDYVTDKPTNISVLKSEKETIPEYSIKCLYDDDKRTKSITIDNYIIDRLYGSGYPIYVIIGRPDGYYYINSNNLVMTSYDSSTRYMLHSWIHYDTIQEVLDEIVHTYTSEEEITYLKKLNSDLIAKKYYEERRKVLESIEERERRIGPYINKEEVKRKKLLSKMTPDERIKFKEEEDKRRYEEFLEKQRKKGYI